MNIISILAFKLCHPSYQKVSRSEVASSPGVEGKLTLKRLQPSKYLYPDSNKIHPEFKNAYRG